MHAFTPVPTTLEAALALIAQQRAELARGAVVRAPQVPFDHAHVGVDVAVGVEVDRHVVVLVTVPWVIKIGLVDIGPVYMGFDLLPGVAIGAVGGSGKPNIFAVDELFNDMSAAVFEGAGIDGVPRVVVRDGGSAEIDIHGGDPAVCRDVVKIAFPATYLDPGLGVPEVHEHAA